MTSTQSADQYLEHRGARLRYRDEGTGAAVVLIHGWTLDLDVWQPQAGQLSRSLRNVRCDRRGFGLSSGLPDVASDVADLQALLDHLEIERATLVGSSQGARVALAFAMQHPERLTAIVLDGAPNTALPSDGEDEVPIAYYRELVLARGMDAFREEWRRHPFTQLQTRDEETHQLLARIIARYPGRDLREPPPPIEPKELQSLASVRVPALIMNGALDTANRRQIGEALCQALPFAERRVLPRAGHLANLDEPTAYNDTIRRFLVRQASIAA